jgi:hypothetical protein
MPTVVVGFITTEIAVMALNKFTRKLTRKFCDGARRARRVLTGSG